MNNHRISIDEPLEETSTTWQTLSRYVPYRPWSKQSQFLLLDCLEAFYGGAAAGGKSQALLMAALMYVHVPGYAALILRRDTRRLGLSGGLIPRSHEWLADKGPQWNASKNQWTFPTRGASSTITFGYLADSSDKFRYGSSEFQFIGFDELTEFPEEDYLFLFSRLRKRVDMRVPLRMRSASNPGGHGHDWVKQRFVSDDRNGGAPHIHWKGEIAFVPAQLSDNPAVSEASYRQSLDHLPSVWRERLLNGDWEVAERGIVQEAWLRDYTQDGDLFRLWSPQRQRVTDLDRRSLRRIMTIDPAGTDGRSENASRRSAAAIQIWDCSRLASAPYLVLVTAYHERLAFDRLCDRIVELNREWAPDSIHIENEKFGVAARDFLKGRIPIQLISTKGEAKITRATPLLKKLERGEVYFPQTKSQGVNQLISELLRWDGESHTNCDQIDAAAYAAQLCPESKAPLQIIPIVVK